ncbi:hypothetical protein FORC087_515 (plasmid) [Bacillus cereus]|nr:hypothetical protein FORC087_515 [Bacillus cereus]
MIVDMLPIAQKRTKNASEIQSTFSQVFEILLLNKNSINRYNDEKNEVYHIWQFNHS